MKKQILCILLISSVILSGCSQYNKMLKSRDMDAKLDYAIRLYDKGEYYKALPLFEELITVFRGTKKAERTYYYYAYTNYQLGDFETAAYDFDIFNRTYPSSRFAEECAFMHAYCYYQDSPDFSLDQTNTYKAIEELKLFADRYPSSARIERCNELIDQLRRKLEIKIFESAKLYLNRDKYKAAITTFNILIHDYPSTLFREQSMFLIVKAQFLFAENSIEEKRIERYSNVLTRYDEFIASFSESRYRGNADDFALTSRKKLEKLSSPSTLKSK